MTTHPAWDIKVAALLHALLLAGALPGCASVSRVNDHQTRDSSKVAQATSNPGRVSRDRARTIAHVYAYSHLLIPIPMTGYAESHPNGGWRVSFNADGVVDENGRFLIFWMCGPGVEVWISPHGRCSTSRPKAIAAVPPPEASPIAEQAAILLARAFAENHGLIPTPTRFEEVPDADGGWYVAVYPGHYKPGPKPEPRQWPTRVLYVPSTGEVRVTE